MSLLSEIWNWKIQLLPILLSILLFEAPAIVRRWKKLFYVPIYFAVFPFRELNENLSTYLAEDEMIGLGERLTPVEAEKLRKKMIVVSTLSMAISTLLTPLFVGFCAAFYMGKEAFLQFVAIFLVYKIILLTKSVYEFHHHLIGTARNRFLLGFVYFCYLGVVFEIMRTSYYWTVPYIQAENWSNLLSDLSTLIFGKALVGILLLSLLTAVFVSLITDREIRERVISGDE